MLTLAMLARTIRRHPIATTVDLALITALMIGATLLAIEYDLVSFWSDMAPGEKKIRTEEAFLLAALLVACLTFFVWRRSLEEQEDRDRWRAIEAEIDEHRTHISIISPSFPIDASS